MINKFLPSSGYPETVSTVPGRIAHTTIFFGALLVSIHYSCWLYSTLTVFVPTFPFDSFQSLLDDGSYTVGVIQGFSIETELKVRHFCYIENILAIQ